MLVFVAFVQYAGATTETSASVEMTQSEAQSIAAQLSRQFVDRLFELRAISEQLTGASNKVRVKDGEGDSDDSAAKLVNKAAHDIRPIIKEFANIVGSALPVGPAHQLAKSAADAVDTLMPLILKYALGI
ncbi:hypothetical protein LPJ58_004563 [Coemansia sp. RSA 1591]|nr:hypothetical protein LPJ58_004563 [Coemansia sp. RSA 1591]KAJ2175023.1 hypothetical protein GGH16_000994 [Coemansia sp. RSA 560]KAJ2433285.1 hypothetical protein IWW41_002147 [Coemansia sp. RSA 2522]KAJ2727112.1 hypothetical protein H4S00_001730 [Coemansia sp. D1744]